MNHPVFSLGGQSVPMVGRARMYVCGITPYDTTHLGHAATFVWTDLAARVLRERGLDVEVCRNVTDVDDDLLDQARMRSVDWRSLAVQQTFRFEDDMRRLRVSKPTLEPRSHNHVDDVIELALALVANGAAYERNGSVYFRGAGVAAAAGLDEARAIEIVGQRGGRPDDAAKDHPLDAVLWQTSAADEPSWPSPFGPGRPGWHAECAAMALTLLGPGIDIHGGGADLAFPHHAYEAAHAEAAVGVRPFARSWMHVGTVDYRGQKIAKSTGNLVFVHDLLEDWPAEVIRLVILARSWAQPWEFDEAQLDAAAARVDRLWDRAGRRLTTGDADVAFDAAIGALSRDLDVLGALDIVEEAGGAPMRQIGAVLGIM